MVSCIWFLYIYIYYVCIYHICVQPAKTANETRSCEGLSAEVCARTSGSTGEWTPDISTVGHLGQNHALNTPAEHRCQAPLRPWDHQASGGSAMDLPGPRPVELTGSHRRLFCDA